MSSEIDIKAREIFLNALEKQNPAQIKAYVDQACGKNEDLRQRVGELLQAQENAGDFLQSPDQAYDQTMDVPSGGESGSDSATRSLPDGAESIGSIIGPYKLLQEIGEGGMGTVYMAQQEKPVKRRVALKIIKQGMDTKQVVARFEAERQALAMMDHPGLAQVLDVGTTEEGRPYFVMELIKGLPITRYCDDKNLNINQRLQLFKAVCNAVQHAHQKGIIHRDLKPSNILVADYDGKPVPKIIDFGLAKALHQQLTDKTMFTQLGQVVGTLEYMSPEQSSMNQLEVDTRTDIYSLGVLLYELLTGTVPFDKKRLRSVALDQVLKIIREEDPPKPSLRLSTFESSAEAASHRGVEPKRLGLMLRGDLDWIVMKALEKDRNRRYETANGFGMDIERYLDGDPVTAAPPSARYRMRKFVRRNRAAVIAASLLATTLVLGVVGTSVGMWYAFDQTELATQQKKLAESASTLASEKSIEAERAREDAEKHAALAEADRNLAQQQASRAEQQAKRAEAILRLLKQMLSSARPGAQVTPSYTVREMLDDFSRELESKPNEDPTINAEIWNTMADAYGQLSEIHKAADCFRRAIDESRKAFGASPKLVKPLTSAARYSLDFANFDEQYAQAKQAEEMMREAIAIQEANGRATTHQTINLGWSLLNQGRFKEAEQTLRQVINGKRTSGRFHSEYVAFARLLLCDTIWYHDRNRLDEAWEAAEQSIESVRDSSSRKVVKDLLQSGYKSKAAIHLQQFEMEEAAAATAQALELLDPQKRFGGFEYVHVANLRIWALVGRGDRKDAFKLVDETLSICRARNKPVFEAETLYNKANLFLIDGEHAKAEGALRSALKVCEESFGPEHIQTVRARLRLAQHFDFVQDNAQARQLYCDLVPRLQLIKREYPGSLWTTNSALAILSCEKLDATSMENTIQELGSSLGTSNRLFDDWIYVALAKASLRQSDTSDAIEALREGLRDRSFTDCYSWLILEEELLSLLSQKKEYAEALRESIAYREKRFTPAHTATLQQKCKLLDELVRQNSMADTESLLQAATTLASSDTTKARKQYAIQTLIRAHQALGQTEKADIWKKVLETNPAASQGDNR